MIGAVAFCFDNINFIGYPGPNVHGMLTLGDIVGCK